MENRQHIFDFCERRYDAEIRYEEFAKRGIAFITGTIFTMIGAFGVLAPTAMKSGHTGTQMVGAANFYFLVFAAFHTIRALAIQIKSDENSWKPKFGYSYKCLEDNLRMVEKYNSCLSNVTKFYNWIKEEKINKEHQDLERLNQHDKTVVQNLLSIEEKQNSDKIVDPCSEVAYQIWLNIVIKELSHCQKVNAKSNQERFLALQKSHKWLALSIISLTCTAAMLAIRSW